MYSLKYILCFVTLASTYGKPSVSMLSKGYTYSAITNNYYKLHKEVAKWQDAVATCRSEGAQLFYPVDEAEAREVDNLLNLWPINTDGSLWIGVSDLRSHGVYETIDGRPLNEVHNKWDIEYGQPLPVGDGSNCVCMWNRYVLWLVSCNNHIIFICKYIPGSNGESHLDYTTTGQYEITEVPTEAIQITTTVNVDSTHSECRSNEFSCIDDGSCIEQRKVCDGASHCSDHSDELFCSGQTTDSEFRADYTYSYNTNNFYKLHEDKVIWKDAVEKCRSEGSQLFYPVDKAEAAEVNSILNPWFKVFYIWIGAFKQSDKVYKTVDGRLLNEVTDPSNVDWNTPFISDGGHCFIMWSQYFDHMFWIHPCDDKISFICKYSPGRGEIVGHTTPNQFQGIIDSPSETTTPFNKDNTPSGEEGGNPVIPKEVAEDKHTIPGQFGNLVEEELKKYTFEEQQNIMISILEVLRSYEEKALTQFVEQINEIKQ